MGSAPSWTSNSLARLNGRDPKNPRDADSGEGCGDSIATQFSAANMGLSVDASRPQRIATIGRDRATSARIAHSVTASQPLPRCDAGLLGRTVSTLFSNSTPRCAQGVRSPHGGLRITQVGGVLVEDVGQAARNRAHLGSHREAQAHSVSRRRVGVLPDDQTRTSSNGNVKARNTFCPAGRYVRPAAISARRN